MNNKKIALISVSLFAVSVVLNGIIVDKIGYWAPSAIKASSILLLLISRIREKSIRINAKYFFLILAIFLPFLYNNAYIEDNFFSVIFNYVFALLYALLLSGYKSEEFIRRYLQVYFIFALLTTIATIMSMINEDLYLSLVRPLFNSIHFEEIKINLLEKKLLFGLTDHYSRNAFFIIIGIYYSIMKIKEKGKYRKAYFVAIFIFMLTLLCIGKRAQMLYGLLAIIISWLVVTGLSLKKCIKGIAISVIVITFATISIFLIPQASRTIDRIFSNKSSDFTTGRTEMYGDAIELYKKNGWIPLGWGRYAQSTNYYHPALHNDYLQLYVEVGLLGTALIIVPNCIFLIIAAKNAKKRDGIYATILTYNIFFLIFAVTGLPRYENEMYSLYFIANSLMFKKRIK